MTAWSSVIGSPRFHSSPNSYTYAGHFDPDKQRDSLLGHGFFTSNSGGHRSLIFPITDCDVNLHNFTGWRRRATCRSCGTPAHSKMHVISWVLNLLSLLFPKISITTMFVRFSFEDWLWEESIFWRIIDRQQLCPVTSGLQMSWLWTWFHDLSTLRDCEGHEWSHGRVTSSSDQSYISNAGNGLPGPARKYCILQTGTTTHFIELHSYSNAFRLVLW